MRAYRRVPLFDPQHTPPTWNERMAPGEYAVHFASRQKDSKVGFYCDIFETLAEAESYSKGQVLEHPEIACSIYDDRGKVGAPVREVRGAKFKANEISARFRRWTGGSLFVVGGGLTIYDWANGFRFLWPSTIGTRVALPGFTLLMVELFTQMQARQVRRREA